MPTGKIFFIQKLSAEEIIYFRSFIFRFDDFVEVSFSLKKILKHNFNNVVVVVQTRDDWPSMWSCSRSEGWWW